MVAFDSDPDLGQVVASRKLYSFGVAPVKNVSEIEFAAGGSKFSSLCGFRFESAAPSQYPVFFIQFASKLRSKRFAQTNRPPMWRVVKQISARELHVLDKKSVLAQYGFDVDKFFQSDLFARTVPKFAAAIQKGLDEKVPAFMAAREAGMRAVAAKRGAAEPDELDGAGLDKTASDVKRFCDSIQDSLRFLKNKTCENAFYKLVDYNQATEAEEASLDEAIEAEMAKIYQ